MRSQARENGSGAETWPASVSGIVIGGAPSAIGQFFAFRSNSPRRTLIFLVSKVANYSSQERTLASKSQFNERIYLDVIVMRLIVSTDAVISHLRENRIKLPSYG